MSVFIRRFQHTGLMRQASAYEAILAMEPPCPLSPHRVHATRADNDLHVRVLFAAEPETEYEVRRRIERALSGLWRFPDGFTTPWQLRKAGPATCQQKRQIKPSA